MVGLIFVPLLFAIGLALLMWRAWAVAILWGWFVTPQFGVAVPAFWMIFGLLLFVSLVKASSSSNKTGNDAQDQKNAWLSLLGHAIAPPLSVAFGWFAKSMM